MAKTLKPEAAIQRLITDWLAANRIWFERRNTGAMKNTATGSFTRFSQPGTADIMATPYLRRDHDEIGGTARVTYPVVVWIEVKAPKGKQSEAQKAFQQEVEAAGHIYILAYSLEDVTAVLT